MLHLTNGESAAGSLRGSGMPGRVISWQDVLHEGPVPAGLTLEGMSDVRARFLARWDRASFPAVSESFAERDGALRSARHVVLWFEHDLYDQLQLLQILATLSETPGAAAEEASFMGDTTVESRLHALIHAPMPLVTPEPYTLTAAGRRVLAGEVDARQLNGIDRWIGGVHFNA